MAGTIPDISDILHGDEKKNGMLSLLKKKKTLLPGSVRFNSLYLELPPNLKYIAYIKCRSKPTSFRQTNAYIHGIANNLFKIKKKTL